MERAHTVHAEGLLERLVISARRGAAWWGHRIRWCVVRAHHQTSTCSDFDPQEGGFGLIHVFILSNYVE